MLLILSLLFYQHECIFLISGSEVSKVPWQTSLKPLVLCSINCLLVTSQLFKSPKSYPVFMSPRISVLCPPPWMPDLSGAACWGQLITIQVGVNMMTATMMTTTIMPTTATMTSTTSAKRKTIMTPRTKKICIFMF